jgi:hydroxymethylbilane synthase
MSSSERKPLVIGSRGSALALWQANHIASRLQGLGFDTRIEIIKTTGDHLQTASLVQAGGKGLFTKEIEEALLEGRIDVAVHSLKDLPVDITPGLAIAAVPQRADPRDALIGKALDDLPSGARIGTSSGRRAAQIRALRPDLRLDPIRGNVDTRLRKLKEGQFEAILLAVAGLQRLGLEREIVQILSSAEVCPAAGQGALAVQTCSTSDAFGVCRQLNDLPSELEVTCERAALAALGGGCQLPVGAYARHAAASLFVRAVVVSPDGGQLLHAELEGSAEQAQHLGHAVAQDLIAQGARAILAGLSE